MMISPSVAIDYLLDPIGKRELHDESVELAVDALRKQIPQKPVQSKEPRFGMGYEYHDWVCPTCGKYLAPEPTYKGNHHCECGQKLDWS
jgi:hypothetical protein